MFKLLIACLACLAVLAFAAPISITPEDCPSQEIDIVDGQLVCVDPQNPPPPPAGACAVAPNLYGQGGGAGYPFFDCGESTQLRSPLPTYIESHYNGALGSGYSYCIMPPTWSEWWAVNEFSNNGQYHVPWANSDSRTLIAQSVPGSMSFNGQRMQIELINGATIEGGWSCGPNASNVELNGECVCP